MMLRNSFRTVAPALLAALLLGQGAYAQDATDSDEPPKNIEDELSLGEEENTPPQPYIKEEFDDWALRCLPSPEADAEERCQMYQLLADDTGAPIAEFSMFRLPNGSRAAAGATVVVPLETALQAQLTIKIDSSKARKYPFAFCNRVGCYSRIGFTEAEITAFKRGNAAVMSITPYAALDQQVSVSMSLKGFTAAYDKTSIAAQ